MVVIIIYEGKEVYIILEWVCLVYEIIVLFLYYLIKCLNFFFVNVIMFYI